MQQEFPAKPKIEAKAVVLERPPGMWRQGWQRFRRNKTGMLGLSLVVLVVLVAMIGPYLAPYDPNDQNIATFFEVDYYADPQRGAVPLWKNLLALAS